MSKIDPYKALQSIMTSAQQIAHELSHMNTNAAQINATIKNVRDEYKNIKSEISEIKEQFEILNTDDDEDF